MSEVPWANRFSSDGTWSETIRGKLTLLLNERTLPRVRCYVVASLPFACSQGRLGTKALRNPSDHAPCAQMSVDVGVGALAVSCQGPWPCYSPLLEEVGCHRWPRRQAYGPSLCHSARWKGLGFRGVPPRKQPAKQQACQRPVSFTTRCKRYFHLSWNWTYNLDAMRG